MPRRDSSSSERDGPAAIQALGAIVLPQSMPWEKDPHLLMPRRENLTNPRPKRGNLTKTRFRARSLAVTHGSMHMERDFCLAMIHESMHALKLRISDID